MVVCLDVHWIYSHWDGNKLHGNFSTTLVITSLVLLIHVSHIFVTRWAYFIGMAFSKSAPQFIENS